MDKNGGANGMDSAFGHTEYMDSRLDDIDKRATLRKESTRNLPINKESTRNLLDRMGTMNTTKIKLTNKSIAPALNARNPDEVQIMLRNKADKSDVTHLMDIKSNKIDTENTMRSIDIMHKQITHIIVLLVEFLKTNVKGSKESEVKIQGKRMYILQNAMKVVNWVH